VLVSVPLNAREVFTSFRSRASSVSLQGSDAVDQP
jgi:hypothetical protein